MFSTQNNKLNPINNKRKNMNKFSQIFFIVVSIMIISTVASAQGTLPDVNLKTLDGKTVKLNDIVSEGKITVLNFWATWCNPCKKELDTIKDFYPEWRDEYNVEFIAVSIDNAGTIRKVKPMVGQRGWEYSVYTDEKGDMMRELNFQTIPQTFLLDQKKNIVYTHNGYVAGDEYDLEDEIKAVFEKSK